MNKKFDQALRNILHGGRQMTERANDPPRTQNPTPKQLSDRFSFNPRIGKIEKSE